MSAAEPAAAGHDALDVVLFSAGPWRVGIEACSVRASRPVPAASAADGQTEVAARLGLQASPITAAWQYLQLKPFDSDGNDCEVMVAGPLELASVPAPCIHALPPLLAARTTLQGLRALALPPGSAAPVLLFAVRALTGAQNHSAASDNI